MVKIIKRGATGNYKYIDGNNEIFMIYLKNGKNHREDGPAKITLTENDDIYCLNHKNEFWLNGVKFDNKEVWFDALNVEQKTKALFNLNEWANL